MMLPTGREHFSTACRNCLVQGTLCELKISFKLPTRECISSRHVASILHNTKLSSRFKRVLCKTVSSNNVGRSTRPRFTTGIQYDFLIHLYFMEFLVKLVCIYFDVFVIITICFCGRYSSGPYLMRRECVLCL